MARNHIYVQEENVDSHENFDVSKKQIFNCWDSILKLRPENKEYEQQNIRA